MALVLTPVIYLVERRIEKYFGPEITHRMKHSAIGKELSAAKVVADYSLAVDRMQISSLGVKLYSINTVHNMIVHDIQ
jgi:hypothetical protein